MSLFFDNPDQGSTLRFADPTAFAGSGYTAPGVLGSFSITGFAGALVAGVGLVAQASLGTFDVQGFQGGLETDQSYVAPAVQGSFDVQGFAGELPRAYVAQGVTGSFDLVGRFMGFVPAPGGLLDGYPAGPDPLSLEIMSLPSNGSLTWTPDGAFDYVPDPGFIGQDQFDYRLWAGGQPSPNVGTVTLHIAGAFDGLPGSFDVQGFAGGEVFGSGYVAEGSTGAFDVQGFGGELQASFATQGVTGSFGVQGFAGTLPGEFRGATGTFDIQAFAGALEVTSEYVAQGVLGTFDITGSQGELVVVTDYVEIGALGSFNVQGFVPGLAQGSEYVAQGGTGDFDLVGHTPTILAGKLPPIVPEGSILMITTIEDIS